MKTLKLRISGMHCESCERTLKRAIGKLPNIQEVKLKYDNEIAEIVYNQEININELIETVRQVGYDATLFNGNNSKEIKPKFEHYINSLFDKKNEVEGKLILNATVSFIILLVLELIAYYGFFRSIPNFWSIFGYYLIFLLISIVLIAIAIWHVKSYGNNFSCMTGMMIGMSVGTWAGKCCGAMGVMEGMMAGLMGGLMGAMTSLMVLNDHLKIIIPILVIASSIILIGLDYLIYKETTGAQIRKINKPSFSSFLTLCFIVTMIITWIMVYGPRSALFSI